MKKYPWMDGARGLAIAAVVIFHFAEIGGFQWFPWLARLASYGWAGVDLFFVLSGFLITGILKDRQSGIEGLAPFYRNRALRILPLFVSTLLVSTVLFSIFYAGDGEALSRWFFPSLPALLLCVQNWLPAQLPPIWVPFGMNHLWSLAAEVQFYVLWPIALLAVPGRQHIKLAIALFATAIAFRLVTVVVWEAPYLAYFSTITRFDAFMIGALAALRPVWLYKRQTAWAAVAVGMALVGVSAYFDRSLAFSGRWMASIGYTANAMVFGGALILLAGSKAVTSFEAILSNAVLQRLGAISFGIFVFHFPLIHAVKALFGPVFGVGALSDGLIFVAWAAVTVVLAEVSFRYLERPFIEAKGKLSRNDSLAIEK